jgi:hypothetical protein
MPRLLLLLPIVLLKIEKFLPFEIREQLVIVV